MSFADMDEGERTGYIRPENRVSVGNGVTNVSSLDPLAFQLAIVGVVVVIGIVVRALLMKIHPLCPTSPWWRGAGLQHDRGLCHQQDLPEGAH